VRILTFTTLFPNSRQPNHGVFVENRLRHLVRTGQVEATVLAPVSWLLRRKAAIPAEEQRHGLHVCHPVWTPVPAIGMSVSPGLLYISAARALSRLKKEGRRFDIIDAHYFYPDGVAAIWLGRTFNLPVVITARGSDVTQFPSYAIPRRLIQMAAGEAQAIITVSAGLRDALVDLGVSPGKVRVLRNGVDLEMFKPIEPDLARRSFGVGKRTLVSVGSLIERKGHHRTIAALVELPGWQLLIAGDGPERNGLKLLAKRLGVSDRVTLLGSIPHADLSALYSAADLSILASSREGWANVLLESMACGTPVIASPIPGNPEVVQNPDAGLIAVENTSTGLANAVKVWEAAPRARILTRLYAERFGWDSTSAGQIALFKDVIGRSRS
jgi:teichuronic acid biosynthesis glycosyltransferase TuaC